MAINENDVISALNDLAKGSVYIPTQSVTVPANQTAAELNQIRRRIPVPVKPTTPMKPGTSPALPQIFSVIATEAPIPGQNQTKCQVTVQITRDPSALNFQSLNVWFTGYHKNSKPQLMCSGSELPLIFACDVTKEKVVVTAQMVGQDGTVADLSSAPSTTLVLNGVMTAPPGPSIAQSLIGTAHGYQFSFNQLPSQLADVIDGYNVYRNTTGALDGTQTKIAYLKQNPQAIGAVVYTDTIVAAVGAFYYYWVSAVDTQGLESVLIPAQSGVVPGSVGSIPPSNSNTGVNGFTWSTTTTSVTFAWPTSPIFRADGTIFGTLMAGTQLVSGLIASQSYTAYPYWDEASQTMKWVGSELVFPTMTSAGLNGSSQFVTTATAVTTIGQPFSIEAWIKTTSATTQTILSLFAPQTGTGTVTNQDMELSVTSTGEIKFQYVVVGTITTVTTSGAGVLDGAWHHVVVSFASGGTIVIYVDTVNVGSASALGGPRSVGINLWFHIGYCGANSGGWANSSNAFFNGSIAHVAYYLGTVLTASQVSNHFIMGVNVGFAGANTYSSLVVGDGATYYWKLSEVVGSTAADSAGSNTGTYQGSPTLNQQAPVVVPSGSPAYCWPYKNFLCTQAQTLRNRIPLSAGSLTPSTPASGSGGGSGGGGGGGGRGGCFSPNTRVRTRRGDIPIKDVVVGDWVLTAKGTWCQVKRVLVHGPQQWTMLDMGDEELVTLRHLMLDGVSWERAFECLDAVLKIYEGCVCDLEIHSNEPDEYALIATTERSYTLANGRVAHNQTLYNLK